MYSKLSQYYIHIVVQSVRKLITLVSELREEIFILFNLASHFKNSRSYLAICIFFIFALVTLARYLRKH